jgi:hypothetical protein
MSYKRKIAPDGTEYVTVTQEMVVNVHLFKGNLARFRAEEAAWRQKAEETEAMIAEVEKIAPDLLLQALQHPLQ